MLNKKVEVKEMNLVGTVYDYNEKMIWVETTEDIFVVKAEMVTEIIEAAATPEQAFEAALEDAGINWDGFVDGDGEYSYIVYGFTYDVMCSLDFNNNSFSMDTNHKGIEKEETEWNNAKEFKKLNTLIRNVIKWAEK
jgi:hypothetical protein